MFSITSPGMQGYATRSFYNLFLCMILICYGIHQSASFEFDEDKKSEMTKMDCDQKLMEEIFLCVSGNGIDLSKFLIVMGGINNTKNNLQLHNTTTSSSNSNSNSSQPPTPGVMMNETTENESESGVISVQNSSLESHQPTSSSVNNKERMSLDLKSPTLNDTKAGNASGKEDVMNEEFKSLVCGEQRDIMECTFRAAKSLLDSPACANSPGAEKQEALPVSPDLLVNNQRYRIRSTVEAIIGQYDVFCAHRCRLTLLDDMRSCYNKFDLDANLFISQESHGAVIGSSAYDVEVFCSNKDSLLQCLRSHSENCPESNLVLSAIGLDMDLMEDGFDILCQHQYTYLRSLNCFDSHTPEVGICHSVKHRRVIDVATKAKLQNWTTQQYLQQVCGVRLDHIECDLKAWAQKRDEACDEHTLELKRKLHCSLIPPQCVDVYRKSQGAMMCNDFFHTSKGSCIGSAYTCIFSWSFISLLSAMFLFSGLGL